MFPNHREGTPHLGPSIPLPSRLLASQCFSLSPRSDSHLSLPVCFQRSYYLVELRVAFVSESDLPASLIPCLRRLLASEGMGEFPKPPLPTHAILEYSSPHIQLF